MIGELPGWRRVVVGEAVELYPNVEGARVTGIRYDERLRPLLPARRIAEALSRRHPELVDAEVGEATPLITHEGEHAALVSVRARRDGQPVLRVVGLVFGDDFYAQVNGVTLDPTFAPTLEEAVRTLVLGDVHALGLRRRRFVYAPPAGWEPLCRGFQTDWFAPGYPQSGAVITVWPASPRGREDATTVADALLAADARQGFVLEHRSRPDPVTAHAGLVGIALEVIGSWPGVGRTWRDLVVLEDKWFLYPMRLEDRALTDRAAHRLELARIIASTYPVPVPATGRTDKEISEHWSR